MSESSRIYLPKHVRSRNAGLGSEKLIYFERITDGRIIIPPVWWAPLPVCRLPKPHDIGVNRDCLCGYVKREANTAKELEAVSRRNEAQLQSEFAQVDEKFAAKLEAKMNEVRAKLRLAMSRAKSNLERDTLKYALKKLEDRERSIRKRKVEGHLAIEE